MNTPPHHLMTWPVAARVPAQITTRGRTWREEYTTHHLEAVVPQRLMEVGVVLPAGLSAQVVEAERALAALEAEMSRSATAVVEASTFALLRSESVSSSRIEGIDVTNRRLAEAIHDRRSAKRLALEVVGNIDAMRAAVEYGTANDPLQPEHLLDIHRRLMATVPTVEGGHWRTVQNWIGASNPAEGVAYVPPPAALVAALVDDLCSFVNDSPTSAVVRAAIAHAQFEAIHPFSDGNGRVGRCLVSVALRKASGTSTIPPVSNVLLSNTRQYFEQLHEFQQNANPAPWIEGFAAATVEACHRARALVDDIADLQRSWRERVGTVRKGSHLERLLDALPTLTLASADQVAAHLDIDPNVARRLLGQLEGVGIVTQTSAGSRNRVWRVDEMLRLLDAHTIGRTDGT